MNKRLQLALIIILVVANVYMLWQRVIVNASTEHIDFNKNLSNKLLESLFTACLLVFMLKKIDKFFGLNEPAKKEPNASAASEHSYIIPTPQPQSQLHNRRPNPSAQPSRQPTPPPSYEETQSLFKWSKPKYHSE